MNLHDRCTQSGRSTPEDRHGTDTDVMSAAFPLSHAPHIKIFIFLPDLRQWTFRESNPAAFLCAKQAATPCSPKARLLSAESRRPVSNRWPAVYETAALPAELRRHLKLRERDLNPRDRLMRPCWYHLQSTPQSHRAGSNRQPAVYKTAAASN